MSGRIEDLGPIGELPPGEPALRKVGGHRLACVRLGPRRRTGGPEAETMAQEVCVIDDRCPHQGYPLSQGTVRDGVLTCQWHNWKFELATGDCTFGGEPVRRYPARVENGRVLVDLQVDRAAEAPRLIASLREALRKNEPARALREALRLGGVTHGFAILAADGAERTDYGFDHSLAMSADLAAWAERGMLPAEEAFVTAASSVGESNLHLPARPKAEPRAVAVSEALRAERRAEAEGGVRALVRRGGVDAAMAGLLPFVAADLLDYGHGAIFLTKAAELARRFPDAAEEVMASEAVHLSWLTIETSLPPWTATREGLARVRELARFGDGEPPRAPLEEAILAGEKSAVKGVVEALEKGASPRSILLAAAHAAAVRVARFDAGWERRLDAEVGVLDVTHALTFAEAALVLAPLGELASAASLAVLAAAFVGKLHRADGTRPPVTPAEGDVVLAAEARDLERALSYARPLDDEARRGVYARLAPFAAFDAAVRPIRLAHTIKMTEAASRLDAADPHAGGAYLEALLWFMVPLRPERNPRRTAEVARAFLSTGRPPDGLY